MTVRCFWLIAAILLTATGSLSAQSEEKPVEIAKDVEAKIIGHVLAEKFQPSDKHVTIELHPDNVQWEFLPTIRNVTFVILTKEEIRERRIEVYFFKKLRRDDDGDILVDLGYGDPTCNAAGSTWAFDSRGGPISDKSRGGWGMGCGIGVGQGNGKSP